MLPLTGWCWVHSWAILYMSLAALQLIFAVQDVGIVVSQFLIYFKEKVEIRIFIQK